MTIAEIIPKVVMSSPTAAQEKIEILDSLQLRIHPLKKERLSCVAEPFSSFRRIENKKGGDNLLSHSASRAVPSASRGLTSVFGMGTGVTLGLSSPPNKKVF